MNELANFMNKDDRFLIDTIIGKHFIVDYGFITQISSDKKKVDVEHLTILKDNDGEQLPKTITKNIEILFSNSSYFSLKYDVKIGDGVLLLGLKDFVKSIAEKKQPSQADYLLHYQQENLKAFPIGFAANPTTKIEATEDKFSIESSAEVVETKTATSRIAIDNSLIEIKNSVSNMRTQIEDLWTAIISINTNLQSWVSTNAAVGSPVTPNPATIGLFTADNITANTKKSNVASFLK
jgi:hypothetical protein